METTAVTWQVVASFAGEMKASSQAPSASLRIGLRIDWTGRCEHSFDQRFNARAGILQGYFGIRMRPANDTADRFAVAQISLTPLPKRGGHTRVVRVNLQGTEWRGM